MTSGKTPRTRRDYLQMLAGVGLAVGFAGCSGDSSSSLSSNDHQTDSPTGSPKPDQTPRLVTATTTPQANGEALAYHVVAEDDNELQYVAVRYGDQEQEWSGDLGRQIDETGQLTELGQPPENSQVTFIARDITGQETRLEAHPDETEPELLNFSVEPTENAGEVSLLLEGKDDIGLKEVQLLLGGKSQLQKNVSGQVKYGIDKIIGVPEKARFRQNAAVASFEDWNGNTTKSEDETYVRRYDTEDIRIDVGINYYPWMGQKFGEILSKREVRPRIGYYNDFTEKQIGVVNNHIDQMQGHGINKVMFTLGVNDRDYQRFKNYEQANLSDDIGIEAKYALPPLFRYNRDMEEDFRFIKENLFGKSNYSTKGGRPIVQFWSPHYIVYRIKDKIEEEYGSLSGFVKYIRKKLTKDGVEPFLVADANGRGHAEFGENEDFWAEWDGLTNWVGNVNPGERIPQEKAIKYVRKDYEGLRSFTNKNGQDFYPMVIPGFNDTHNEEWGQDRVIPRSTSAFRQRLEMAEKYADGRINIYSFNEWAEGSQIEPGTFLGNEYGTDYLQVVEEFQSTG